MLNLFVIFGILLSFFSPSSPTHPFPPPPPSHSFPLIIKINVQLVRRGQCTSLRRKQFFLAARKLGQEQKLKGGGGGGEITDCAQPPPFIVRS